MLAKEYGISLEGAFGGSRDKEELYEINRQAARFYYRALRQHGNPGYTYMKNRGISEEILNRFGIGYADDRWDSLYTFLKEKGFPKTGCLSSVSYRNRGKTAGITISSGQGDFPDIEHGWKGHRFRRKDNRRWRA